MDISLGPEANIDLIRALEKRTGVGDADVIKLKRDLNSLLNISTRVPPEILGQIFIQSLVREHRFEGLEKGSYNFLLVCHHWFEVASHTPELWSFWGNTFQDWKKRHHRSGTIPLDLVLSDYRFGSDPFDESLRNAVRNRVTQDTIRQVHLASNYLTPVISSLTPDDRGGQNENIESIALHCALGSAPLDVSNFFARSRLSRLRSLRLFGSIIISSLDRLIPRTTLLTTLSLDIEGSSSPAVTTSQLFSILTSNTNLQELSLGGAILPNDADTLTFKVQLHHLKILSLRGEFSPLFGLLCQLTLQDMLNELRLTVFNSTVENISQNLAPYMRDYFRHNPRFQDRLGVCSSSYRSISILVGVVRTRTAVPVLELPRVFLNIFTTPDILDRLFIDLITQIPPEHVVAFQTRRDVPREVFFAMPNIDTLNIIDAKVSEGFLQPNPDGPHPNTKLLPSLRSLSLNDLTLSDKEWGHLTTYLAHQTSDGQAISLEIEGNFPHLCLEVMEEVEGLVEEFNCYQEVEDLVEESNYQDPVTICPLGRCKGEVRGSWRSGGMQR